ncbi:phenylpropionate dioxygenase-like ring-hydroxylating dioxygenase large terminal subunit [Novosphingobium chloroacetimidivorans]|uniref:Phenylpropionate dioxygenase-like ring-hydroxylating dioxygenase large terminal subunit n=1 Tax=Novosphingobium chloroacetimidivorans TaxID=1428314 RepID=A0A7W7NVL2_9SPHN|nr:aromatic ring-hydroxylating dioxygenase subunit alpha [Novosphingobium chloroacetimidivorans]MBB4858638.1 phenylpropionate dioxygenase-like ring-hydroxylating dioxygenase large terminal subunit [Novosphingobium chloroacetimidivorans]
MFVTNAWYVGAWSHEVQGTALFSRKLLGEQIVFFRKTDGTVAALRDRCSHRFAPLSTGRHEGDCVRCMYHGLVFDAAGTCTEEPGRSRPSPGLDVQAYPVEERWKQLWVWMGDPALADPGLIPDCTYQDDPAWASIPAYIHYDADYRLILDNLMDFSHLSFVHENTLGGSRSIAATRPKVERIDDGVRMTRMYPVEHSFAPYLRGFETFSGPIDRWHVYELRIGGNVFTMDSVSAPAGTSTPDGYRDPRSMQFRATQIVTPETAHSSHFFWTYAHNFNIQDANFTRKLASRINEGFVEDKLMIEAQQKVIDGDGEDGMGYILADNGLALFRRMLDERLQSDAKTGVRAVAA